MQAQAGRNKRRGAAPAAVAPVLFSHLGKTRKSVSELRMETSVGVGEKREEGGREEGQSLGLGFGSSSCSSCLPPKKLARTEAFPFRMVAPAPCSSGPTLFYGGSCDAYEAAITLQPLPSAFRSPGLGVGAGSAAPAGPRRFSFTPAQWQELQRQAMIYKHFVASVPVPVDLLLSNAISSFPDASPHLLSPNLVGRGGGVCYNLRFGNSADPEPGRCRRTDGKKWRCSRDVAPGQKYCERHVHRGRPRSRKPVELQKAKPITTIDPVATTTHSRTTTALDNNPSSRTTTTTLSRPFAVQSTGFLPKSELKLPFLSMEPNMDPRFSEWAKGDGKKTATNEQWELMQPKIVSRSSAIPVLQHYDDQLNLNGTDLNDHCCPFLNPDLSSLGEDSIVDNRDPPRSFIDAWSTEGLTTATSGDRSSVSSAGKLPLSTLSLSMCGFEEDADQVEMDLGVSDAAAKSPHSSWMAPGPLGEVLQSSNVTSPHQGGSSSSKGSCGGGLINLMGKGCCGSQELCPQESLTTVVSSPTGVLQKAVVSLSDSICCSSPTSAAATSRPEFTLKWISQRKQES